MTSKSWTPEKIKDLDAVKRRGGYLASGAFCMFVAYYLAGMAGSGAYPFVMFVCGGAMFYFASQVKIWKVKKAEAGVYD